MEKQGLKLVSSQNAGLGELVNWGINLVGKRLNLSKRDQIFSLARETLS